MPLPPGNLINAHQGRHRGRIELFLRQFLQHALVNTVYCFIVQAQIPASLLVGGNGGKPINMLGKPQGETLLNPAYLLDPDRTIFNTADLTPGNMKKNPFTADWQILQGDHIFAVDSALMDTAAAGTDRW